MSASTALPVLAAAILTIAASAALPSQGRQAPARLAESIDFARYAGSWFEIARLPNPLQNKCVADVTAYYARRVDGRIDVINRCRTAAGTIIDTHGIGRLAHATTDARWQVRYASGVRALFGGGWTEYWILGVGPEYTWAVAGSPTRDRLWILSRTPEMSAASYEQALAIARGNGFEVGELIETRQRVGE